VAVDGNGDLLMTSAVVGGPTKYGFGQVEPDGTFIEWWQGEVALPAPPDRLLGLSQVHAWLTTSADSLLPSGTGTSTVSLLHRGSVVGSRTWSPGARTGPAWPGTATCSQSTAGSAKGAKLGTI
jgi:hypothetical protein